MPRASEQQYRSHYPTRILASAAGTLLILVLAVRLWPIGQVYDPLHLVYRALEPDVIVLDDIQPTRQLRRPPPPPAPLPPVIMPEDRILEDPPTFDADFLPLDNALPPDNAVAEESSEAQQVRRADSGPKPVRIAEPEYPRAARRRNIRAEVEIRVDIDRQGRVIAHEVTSRYLLGEDGSTREPVTALGFGLEEAAVSAARRWLFRPARKEGQTVRSQYALSVKFGV